MQKNHTEIRLNAGPLSLAAFDNQASGPVILGLHGYLDNAASLLPLMDFFPDYRFIALDLAGHGQSDHRPLGAHYDQAAYLQDLFALVQAHQLDDLILLGHSLGGILATMFAALFPEYVRCVVSIDACGPLTKEAETTADQMRESILSRQEKRRGQPAPVDLQSAVEARCRISDIDAQHARTILSRNLKQTADGHSLWASDPRLRTRSTLRMTERQAENLMRNIRCPVWFGAASNSFKQLNSLYKGRQDWFVHSECDSFEGGHHIHMEQPEAVSQQIRRFVEQM